ncbi:8241_t:CDS:2, partial [Racocetra persica]
SGKSTLGNILGNILDKDSCKFKTEDSNDPVTKNCEKCSIIFKNNTIDTPGLNQPTSVKLISKSIYNNFKIKEIRTMIFVIVYGSFDNTLKIIKLLGDQTASNKIVAFTKLDRKQIKE